MIIYPTSFKEPGLMFCVGDVEKDSKLIGMSSGSLLWIISSASPLQALLYYFKYQQHTIDATKLRLLRVYQPFMELLGAVLRELHNLLMTKGDCSSP